MEIKKELLKLKPVEYKNYKDFDLDSLAVYALYFLESKKIPLYFDYISVALFKLFPMKFSMANFRRFPDTNRISKAVRRLVDQKRKNWATGNLENGFYITDIGVEISKQVEALLSNPSAQKRKNVPSSKRSRGRSAENDVEEIKGSDVFLKWSQKDYKITDYEILSLLRSMPYTPKHLLKQYLDSLKQSAITIKDKSVIDFLNWIEEKFYNLFH